MEGHSADKLQETWSYSFPVSDFNDICSEAAGELKSLGFREFFPAGMSDCRSFELRNTKGEHHTIGLFNRCPWPKEGPGAKQHDPNWIVVELGSNSTRRNFWQFCKAHLGL